MHMPPMTVAPSQALNIRGKIVRPHSLTGMYHDLCTSCLSFSNWSFALNRRRGDAHKLDRKTGRLKGPPPSNAKV